MKNGITLMSLVVMLVIMIILTSTIIITSNSIINDSLGKSFGEEMYSVKNLVEEYEFMHGKYPLKNEVLEIDISLINENYKNQFEGENIIDNKISFKEIDYARAGVSKLNRGMKKQGDKDCYVFSTITKKIYYLQGVELDGKIYYTLTDELYLKLGINEIN